MFRFLFDTVHLTLYYHGRPSVVRRFTAHLSAGVGISSITIQETLRGRLAAVSSQRSGPLFFEAYKRLAEAVELLAQFPVAPFDAVAEQHYRQILALRLRIGSQDQRIAAVARANNLTLLTANRRDFARIPGLVLDDWSV